MFSFVLKQFFQSKILLSDLWDHVVQKTPVQSLFVFSKVKHSTRSQHHVRKGVHCALQHSQSIHQILVTSLNLSSSYIASVNKNILHLCRYHPQNWFCMKTYPRSQRSRPVPLPAIYKLHPPLPQSMYLFCLTP